VRLRPDLSKLLILVLLAVATPAISATAIKTAPTPQEVDRAIDAIRADPNLATKKTVRRLVWDSKEKKKEKEPRKASGWPKWLSWIGDLFGWIAETSQMLFWLLIAALAAFLAVFLVRLFATRVQKGNAKRFVAPTHVQDLDIRPESLPDDIGAAARQLWDRGDTRAALALLYRGLLSRLAHVYEVPIRDSSTEGDCLLLAGRVLAAHRTEYATRLVRTWQRAIYGGLSVEAAVVHDLCDTFDTHLEKPVITTAPRREAFSRGAAA
jgi:hypothetical protein